MEQKYPRISGTGRRSFVIGEGPNRIYIRVVDQRVEVRDYEGQYVNLQHEIAYQGVDPTVNDDYSKGYRANDIWINHILKRMFVCTVNTVGAAEWNKIQGEIHVDTVNPTVDDDQSAGYAISDMWINRITNDLFVCLDDTVGAAVWHDLTNNRKNIFISTIDPTVNDDISLGYLTRDLWINKTLKKTFVCEDNTDGAAVWTRTSYMYHIHVTLPTVTDDGTQGYLVNDIWIDRLLNMMFVCTSNATGAAVWDKLNNSVIQKTTDPTTHDDIADGYFADDIWCNTTNKRFFICTNNTLNNAVWTRISYVYVVETTAPTVNDDITLGYIVKDTWYNKTDGKIYICNDNTDGAAVWQAMTPFVPKYLQWQIHKTKTGTNTMIPGEWFDCTGGTYSTGSFSGYAKSCTPVYVAFHRFVRSIHLIFEKAIFVNRATAGTISFTIEFYSITRTSATSIVQIKCEFGSFSGTTTGDGFWHYDINSFTIVSGTNDIPEGTLIGAVFKQPTSNPGDMTSITNPVLSILFEEF